MIRIISMLLLTFLGGCAHGPYPADDDVRLAEEAYQSGTYPIAESYLEKILADDYVNHDKGGIVSPEMREKAVWVLSHTYWESGKDKRLLRHADIYHSNFDAEVWLCRVLDRRGHMREAKECWAALHDESRSFRTARTHQLIKEFLGSGEYGLR